MGVITVPSLKLKPTKRRYGLVLLFGIIVVALCAWFRAYLDLWLQGIRIGFGQLSIAPVAFSCFPSLVRPANSAPNRVCLNKSRISPAFLLAFCDDEVLVKFLQCFAFEFRCRCFLLRQPCQQLRTPSSTHSTMARSARQVGGESVL